MFKKTGLYLGHMTLKKKIYTSIILMKKAPGKDYGQILSDPLITDQEKIQIHDKIIDKYNQLLDEHAICHADTKSEHVFVDLTVTENQITIVDFGSSYFPFFRFFNYDIQQFNQNIKYYIENANSCSITFIRHVESLIKNDKKRKNISILSLGLRSIIFPLISLGFWVFIRKKFILWQIHSQWLKKLK